MNYYMFSYSVRRNSYSDHWSDIKDTEIITAANINDALVEFKKHVSRYGYKDLVILTVFAEKIQPID